jgi:hypothetical protein
VQDAVQLFLCSQVVFWGFCLRHSGIPCLDFI